MPLCSLQHLLKHHHLSSFIQNGLVDFMRVVAEISYMLVRSDTDIFMHVARGNIKDPVNIIAMELWDYCVYDLETTNPSRQFTRIILASITKDFPYGMVSPRAAIPFAQRSNVEMHMLIY